MNPPIGEDIDPTTLDSVTGVLRGTYKPSSSNENAQLRELAFWRWVAYEGYNGRPPEAFWDHQKLFMTQCYQKTGWALERFSRKSTFELGCGPLGMTEFIPADARYAYDPLNEYYSKLFKKVRSTGIRYLQKEGEILDIPQVDFGICFNVLDHTPDAKKYLDLLFSKIRPDGCFLIQVNTVKHELKRTPEHESMHPSPLTFEQISYWVKLYSRDVQYELSREASADNEFFYMCWGTKSATLI
jgi:SAM-dependent methyltransferase